MQEGLNKEEAEVKVGEFVESIPQMIEVGKVLKDDKGRLKIKFDNFVVGIKDNWKGEPTNKWIVTSYVKKENGESLYASSPITKGETLPLNSSPYSSINNPDANTIIKKLKDYPLDNHMNIKEDEINNLRKDLERQLNINPIKEFGKNYAEYYQDGKGAIKKLIDEYKEFERFNQKAKKRTQKKVRC